MFGLFLFTPAFAQNPTNSGLSSVTLYSPAKYKLTNSPRLANGALRPDFSRAYFSFSKGRYINAARSEIGFGQIGDWFMLTPSDENRSVIKDLGKQEWSDQFKVAALKPLSKLNPGEHLSVIVDVSGTSGGGGTCTGVAGYFPGVANVESRGMLESGPSTDAFGNDSSNRLPVLTVPCSPGSGKSSHRSKLEPRGLFARVIPGHVYEIHIVDPMSDYYVLFRVESLVAGDTCTFSWKRIPTPSG
jgi:hypothetical protein